MPLLNDSYKAASLAMSVTIDMPLKMINTALLAIIAIENGLAADGGNRDAKKLLELQKKGVQLCGAEFSEYSLNELHLRLQKAGVRHIAVYNDNLGKRGQIIFAENQMEKARGIFDEFVRDVMTGDIAYTALDKEHVKQLLKERMFEDSTVVPKRILNAKSNNDLRKIPGLSLPEALLFIEHAQKNGLCISVEQPGKDSFNICYSGEDKQTADAIKGRVAIELAGPVGEITKQQLLFENKKYVDICEKAINPSTNNLVLADLNGSEIKIDEDKAVYNGTLGHIQISKYDSNYEKEMRDLMAHMRGASEFSKEEFDQYTNLSREEKIKMIHKKDVELGRPEITEEQYRQMKRFEQNRELYESKLAMDNASILVEENPITNNEVRYGEFASREKQNIEFEHDTHEWDQEDAVIMDDARASYKGYMRQDQVDNTFASEEIFDEMIRDSQEKGYADINQDIEEYSVEDFGNTDILSGKFDSLDGDFIRDSEQYDYYGNPFEDGLGRED